jgi:YobI-like P-loop NTPase
MFIDQDRIKFFDFLIPIIPVINFSNSNEILSNILVHDDSNLSKELIDNISFFINDMRLLYNITNEYKIYHSVLHDNLTQDKLLSIIVYKNLYPNDFSELSNNKGILFETLKKKEAYIEEIDNGIDDEIDEIKKKIEEIETINITDIKELRAIYILKIILHIMTDKPEYRFNKFIIKGKEIDNDEILSDELFEKLIIAKAKYSCFYSTNSRNEFELNLDFHKIENKVDPSKTYNQRVKLIEESRNKKSEELKNKMEKLEAQKKQNNILKLKDLLSNNSTNIELKDEKVPQLLILMLRNGYIAEDYLDYISIFYEGSITKSDYYFLLNVKSQTNLDFDYKLNKISNIIDKISPYDFNKKYTLNYNLLDFILETNKYDEQKSLIFTLLKNESAASIEFILGFIENGININLFIKDLCKTWHNIWYFIENDSKFSENKIDKFFELIIEYADLEDLSIISDNSNINEHIINSSNFLSCIKDTQKLKGVIKTLDIKFHEIDIKNTSSDFLEYIYAGNYYEINEGTVKTILAFKKKLLTPEFYKSNYTVINESECNNLINYVDENIDEYITNLYLNIDTNTEEKEESLLELLSNEYISLENREKIIAKSLTKITDISKITEDEIINSLLDESKVFPSWENIIYVYGKSEKKITEHIVSFINANDNSKILSKEKIEISNSTDELDFSYTIILNENIMNNNYEQILKSIPFVDDTLEFSGLSFEKVEILIKNDFLYVNGNNFNLLKADYDLHIYLIERNYSEFVENIESFEFEDEDILAFLESATIPDDIKNKILENFDESTFFENVIILNQVGKLLLNNHKIDISKLFILTILKDSSLNSSEKIILFNIKHELFDNSEITEFLNEMEEPYSRIAKKRKRPLIETTENNVQFAENLRDVGYISSFKYKEKGIKISTFNF